MAGETAFCRIPVSARMVRQEDGTYTLDPERSTFADVPADTVAQFLLTKFGVDAMWGGEKNEASYSENI